MDCPHCGTSNRDEDEFCRKCRKPVQNGKDISKTSKLKVGWMVWWRTMLPIEIIMVLLGWLGANFVISNLATLPFLFLLLNWAGKVVARREYGLNISYVGKKNLAIGFTIVPIPAIGWGIWWRMMVISIPLRLLMMMSSGYAASSGDISFILLQLLLLPIYLLLMIIALGWAAKRTIEPMKVSME